MTREIEPAGVGDVKDVPSPGSVVELRTIRPLKRRIAVVQLWPERPVAEHENIERITRAARRIGVDVIRIDRIGFHLDGRSRQVTNDDVDFVLHLHYETGKTYDCFSYGALWNPVEFYFDWGYKIHASNQISHDAFASAGAATVEDIVVRARPGEFRRGGFPLLNHSLSEPVYAPRLRTDRRAFYCGINWEKVGGKATRHSRLLEQLDAEGLVDIYGPDNIVGVHPWEDFKGYRRPLPFDGVSIIRAAAESGAVLVLSSEAHKRSGVMSNRLFECLASGALIIGDSHDFLRQNFSDCMLVIDDEATPQQQAQQAVAHLRWANAHPQEAFALIERAQARFIDRFMLDRQLLDLYRHYVSITEAKQRARDARSEQTKLSVCLMPLSGSPLDSVGTLESLSRQSLGDFEVVLASRQEPSQADRDRMSSALPSAALKFVNVGDVLDQPMGNFGLILGRLLHHATGDVFAVSFGMERFFSTYVETMTGHPWGDREGALRFSGLLEHFDPDGKRFIDLNDPGWQAPHLGLLASIAVSRARYDKARSLLDHVDASTWMRMLTLGYVGDVQLIRTPHCVVPLDRFEAAHRRIANVPALLSSDRVSDLLTTCSSPSGGEAPGVARNGFNGEVELLRALVGQEIDSRLSGDMVKRMPEQQRMELAFALYDSLPIPRAVKAVLRGLHRLYCRFGSKVLAVSGRQGARKD